MKVSLPKGSLLSEHARGGREGERLFSDRKRLLAKLNSSRSPSLSILQVSSQILTCPSQVFSCHVDFETYFGISCSFNSSASLKMSVNEKKHSLHHVDWLGSCSKNSFPPHLKLFVRKGKYFFMRTEFRVMVWCCFRFFLDYGYLS